MTELKDIMIETPEIIYLTDDLDEDSLCWCEHKITDNDIKYIRADVADYLQEENKKLKEIITQYNQNNVSALLDKKFNEIFKQEQ